MLAALSPDMLATDLAYYLARKGVCRPIFEWVRPRPDHVGEICKTELSLRKRIKCLSSTILRRNLKMEVLLWKRIKCLPSTIRRRNLKMELSLQKRINCFPSTLRRRNLKTQQSPVILNLFLRKPCSGNHVIIVTSSFSQIKLRSLLKFFLSTLKRRTIVFKFLRF